MNLAPATLGFTLPVFTADDAWTVATVACCATACALLGCFLVLRRLSLLGDAISHAILPGLAAAFIITSSRGAIPMLVGATVVGLITAVFSSAIHRWGRIPEDAAMGVVFTSLFAVGVILITWGARDVDLDPGCVLYGVLETIALHRVDVLGFSIPPAFVSLAVVLAVVVLVLTVAFKELKIVSFDSGLAASLGFSVALIHYTFMGLVAATTVVSFEAVGSILVIVMLIAPAASAHLLTDRLSRMLWISALIAIGACVAGYLLAVWVDTSVAGMISVVLFGVFILTSLLAPRYGVISKLAHRVRLAVRILGEDVLGMLYRWHERAALSGTAAVPPLSPADLRRGLQRPFLTRLALASLSRQGLIERAATVSLTPRGMDAARGIVRSHRLWESFLAKHLGLPLDHLHEPSHRVEHFITAELQTVLSREVGEGRDPHGSAIPGPGTASQQSQPS